jgi:hypothetical protein
MEPSDRRRALALGLAVFAALAPGAFLGVPGKSVAGAWRVLAGEVPYRDFWSMYAPGQFYATAAVLALTGKQVLAPALVACAVKALTASLLYLASISFGAARGLAFVVCTLLGLALFEIAPELSSYPPALALIAAALTLIARQPARPVAAGLLLGVAAFFKHDVAAYGTAAIVVGLAGEPWLADESAAQRSKGLRDAWTVGSAALGVVALLALGLAWMAGRDALVDLVLFPLGDFRIVRSEPYPALWPNLPLVAKFLEDTTNLARGRDAAEALSEWLLGNAPQAAFAAALLVLIRRRRSMPRRVRLGLAILIAALPLFWWAAHTQQNTHFTSMGFAAVLALLLASTELRGRATRRLLLGLALLQLAALFTRPLLDLALPLRAWSRIESLDLPHATGIHVSPREREVYSKIRAFTDAHVAPDEPVYLGVERHDAIVINNPRFVWLLDRPCATRYHELHPAITDREDVQREMIAELERRGVRCAVIWRFGWAKAMLDSIVAQRRSAIRQCGSTLLDEFLAREFRPVLEVGEYVVLWRELER